jgi:hypothetical protein
MWNYDLLPIDWSSLTSMFKYVAFFAFLFIDINQSVEPVDQRTRDSLQKSVQLAIEITTKAQEATARQESARLDQEAAGRLERQKIIDQAEAGMVIIKIVLV